MDYPTLPPMFQIGWQRIQFLHVTLPTFILLLGSLSLSLATISIHEVNTLRASSSAGNAYENQAIPYHGWALHPLP